MKRGDARAHKQYLGLKNKRRSRLDLTVTRSPLQTLCSENPRLARGGVPSARPH